MTRITMYLQVVWLTGFKSKWKLLGFVSRILFSIHASLMGLLDRNDLVMWVIIKYWVVIGHLGSTTYNLL